MIGGRQRIALGAVALALTPLFLLKAAAAPEGAGAASEHRSSAALFARAQQAIAGGNLTEAASEVKRGLALDPSSVEGLNLLGIVLAKQGDAAGALASFKKALAIDPSSARTHDNLGSLYTGERQLGLAESEFRATLRLDPGDRTANYNLGAILLSRGRAAAAIPFFLRVAPPDTASQFALAEAYFASRQTAKGLELVRALSAASPEDLRLHFSLGALLASARLYTEAAHEFEIADALKPGTFEILYNLSEARLSAGDDARAESSFGRALALKPDSVAALYGDARACQGQNQTLQAFQLLFRARKLAPKNTDVIFLLARLSMKQAYYEDAIPLLEEGVKIAPRRADLHAALGESYYSAGKIQKAFAEFQTLLSLDPSASSYNFMGLYYRHQGQFDEARKYFKLGLGRDPSNSGCLFNLGYLAEKQGDYDAAAGFLERALKSNPAYQDALFELAAVRILQKRFAAAVPLLKRCASLDPNQSKVYYKLAIAERDLGNESAAENDLKIFETLAKNPSPMPMPFQDFFASVSEKVSLSPYKQAEIDRVELLDEVKAHPDRPRTLYLLAQTYLKLGDTHEALATLDRLRTASGGDTRTLIGAGVLLARYGLYTGAIDYFKQALAADPGSDDAKYDLADALFDTGDAVHALEWLDRLSPSARIGAPALALRGDAEARLGRFSAAKSSLEKAVQASPDKDGYYLSLALAEIQSGDLAGAANTLARGKAQIPDSGLIAWGHGVLAVVQGRNEDAQRYFETALDLMPEWESSYSALGTFYFDTGQISKARQTLDRYARIFPHGRLNVAALRRTLAAASTPSGTPSEGLPPPARSQFLAMALTLAQVNR